MDPSEYILDYYKIDGSFFVIKYEGYKEFDLFINEILDFIPEHDDKLYLYLAQLLRQNKYEEALDDLVGLDYDFYDLINHYIISSGTYSILRPADDDQLDLF
mgnify:CR=1 FL=1|tara:strand:+ start:75 stop:380 length:306 start_codon:yes stop_codon:yes gene_type:complete